MNESKSVESALSYNSTEDELQFIKFRLLQLEQKKLWHRSIIITTRKGVSHCILRTNVTWTGHTIKCCSIFDFGEDFFIVAILHNAMTDTFGYANPTPIS